MNENDHQELEAAKKASLGQVLLRTARRFNERGIARVRDHTGLPLRPAHLALFPHIDLDGTRATEIAARQGVSKQAVGPLLGDLVKWGVLERVPDPDDGRARLLRFSREEGMTLLDGLAVLSEIEAELARLLGTDRLDALRRELLALDAALDEPEPSRSETAKTAGRGATPRT
jgi:DNA-binding MarR family transcriptional regulator